MDLLDAGKAGGWGIRKAIDEAGLEMTGTTTQATETTAETTQEPERYTVEGAETNHPPSHPEPSDDEFRGDEGEEPGEQPGEPEQPEQPRRLTVRERLAEEARARAAERQRADQLQALLDQQAALLAQRQQPEQPQTDPYQGPNPDDYPAGRFDPGYMDALVSYQVQQRFEQQQAQMQQAQTVARLQHAEAQFSQQFTDYGAAKEILLLNPAVADNPAIGAAISESSIPAHLVYYLGGNPQVADQIARMHPLQATRAMGMIEMALLQAGQQQTKQVALKPPPAPITPIGTQPAEAPKGTGYRTYAEFVAMREKQEAARGRR